MDVLDLMSEFLTTKLLPLDCQY